MGKRDKRIKHQISKRNKLPLFEELPKEIFFMILTFLLEDFGQKQFSHYYHETVITTVFNFFFVSKQTNKWLSEFFEVLWTNHFKTVFLYSLKLGSVSNSMPPWIFSMIYIYQGNERFCSRMLKTTGANALLNEIENEVFVDVFKNTDYVINKYMNTSFHFNPYFDSLQNIFAKSVSEFRNKLTQLCSDKSFENEDALIFLHTKLNLCSTHGVDDFEFFKAMCNGHKWKFALKIFHNLYNSDGKATVKIIEKMISDISTDNEELGNDIRERYREIIERITYQRMYPYPDSDSDSYSESYSDYD